MYKCGKVKLLASLYNHHSSVREGLKRHVTFHPYQLVDTHSMARARTQMKCA